MLEFVECTGHDEDGGPCKKRGTSNCSNCRLVKYCSKAHQTAHWAIHRKQCKDPIGSDKWKPGWVSQNREASFITSSGPMQSSFGAGHYLWGNMPAIDCLHVDRNEGKAACDMNLNLCFAASGDIRNAVQTVNGLPGNYTGQCNVIINDHDPAIFVRNIAILLILLDGDITPEEVAETVVHISYSLRLTPGMEDRLKKALLVVQQHAGDSVDWRFKIPSKMADVNVITSVDHVHYLVHRLLSSCDMATAEQTMKKALWDPSRADYRDRYFWALKPPHRLAAVKFRTSGMALPFGGHLNEFTRPNKSLFWLDGQWLLPDSADPLHCWELTEVLKSGARHGAHENDLYGALFFHARAQFATFARRCRSLQISFTVGTMDARELAKALKGGGISSLPAPVSFDRIETSNIADHMYVGIGNLLRDWAPLLNRGNSRATLLVHFMNWITQEPDASPMSNSSHKVSSQVKRAMEASLIFFDVKKDLNPFNAIGGALESMPFSRAMANSSLFYDNRVSFERYLKGRRADEIASSVGLARKTMHTIVSQRAGISLDKPSQVLLRLSKDDFYLYDVQGVDWSDRFVEYGISAERQ